MEYGRNFWLKVSFMVIAFITKNYFEISSCKKPFLDPLIYFIKVKKFAQNYKFSNKNDMFAACRDFKKKTWGECYKHK